MWSAILASIALAASVQVTLEVGPDGAVLRDAVLVQGTIRVDPGPIEIVDAAGQVLTTAALPDPRVRTLILPTGGGIRATRDRGVGRVEVPWPDGAAGLRLGAVTWTPRTIQTRAGDPIQVLYSGPDDERLDLVFLGDGYTQAELIQFAADVDGVVDHLLTLEPYGQYAALFNVWRVDTASATSGIGSGGVGGSTAYRCYYDCGGIERLVCCDDTRVMNEIAASVPGADGIIVLVNSDQYGGSGAFNYATSYTGEYRDEVAAHELGHSLVGLWDEYSYEMTGSGQGAPNCASSADATPWEEWRGDEGVDAFRVCSYTNLYRPTANDCMMRTLQDDYCAVCRQDAVLAIYEHLPGLILGTEPAAGSAVTAAAGEEVPFVLDVPPASADVRFEWAVNGEVIAEDEPDFVLDGCSGHNGTLTLTVRDTTPWVRRDVSLALQDTASWVVTTETCGGGGLCGCSAAATPGAPWLLGALALLLRRRPR
ncbi:MAG: hypothetical protein JRJ84_09315 [Deltaproteobacteria bacterium]|nr:hypothetical protein [Deltaproteobacteria bacterium]